MRTADLDLIRKESASERRLPRCYPGDAHGCWLKSVAHLANALRLRVDMSFCHVGFINCTLKSYPPVVVRGINGPSFFFIEPKSMHWL